MLTHPHFHELAVPQQQGFKVLDVCSRKIVGWALSVRQTVELVQAALSMAVQTRGARGVVFHSDHGCQYTAVACTRQCVAEGIERSLGAVGNCHDNNKTERACRNIRSNYPNRPVSI